RAAGPRSCVHVKSGARGDAADRFESPLDRDDTAPTVPGAAPNGRRPNSSSPPAPHPASARPAAAAAAVVPERRCRGELGCSLVTRTLTPHVSGRRVPVPALHVTKQTISRPDTAAAGRLQNVARRQLEGVACGRRQRGGKLR